MQPARTHFANSGLKVIRPETVSRSGMALEQLGRALAAHGVSIEVVRAEDITFSRFRHEARGALAKAKKFVIVNYFRTAINQERGGHISPLAAYHEMTDRFLIMDVARYKYPPVWVKARDLWRAMQVHDPVSGRSRGYVLVAPGADKREKLLVDPENDPKPSALR